MAYDTDEIVIESDDQPKVGRPTNEAKLKEIHADALEGFAAVWDAQKEVREQCLLERRFNTVPGAQWEGPLLDQFDNKPRFEVNKIESALVRITGEYRNNRVAPKFEPKDGAKRGSDKLADACASMHRADAKDSAADEARDNAFDEALNGGMGAWRLRARHEDEYDDENDRQRIGMEPIPDADQCVFFDLDAVRQDKADAKRCWVLFAMSPEAFKAEYPEGGDPVSWPKDDTSSGGFDWSKPDLVVLAEHYRVEEKKVQCRVYEDASGASIKLELGEDEDGDPMWYETASGESVDPRELKVQGYKLKSDKKVKRKAVHKYVMSGNRIEEDCGRIAGTEIPIVVTYGKRWFVDKIERFKGHGRNAMDSQRLANMQRSKLAEISALSSVEKPILTPEQVAGHAAMWADDTVKNYPYLLVNPITDAAGQKVPAGPIGYTKPPSIPPAMAAILQQVEQDMKDLLGNEDSAENLQQGQSGKAVKLVQNRIDERALIYISNFAKAVRREAEIWLSMARELYTQKGRKLKTLTPQNEVGSVTLMGRPLQDDNGAQYLENDLRRANFDVDVDVGPSSSSKRAATVEAVTALRAITQDPQAGSVLESVAIMNMDGEGVSEVREFFRQKLVRGGVIQPTEEEKRKLAEEQANAKPDPQSEYLMAEANKSNAEAGKVQADTQLSIEKTELTKAQTAETLAGIGRDDNAQAIDLGKTLHEASQPKPQPGAPK